MHNTSNNCLTSTFAFLRVSQSFPFDDNSKEKLRAKDLSTVRGLGAAFGAICGIGNTWRCFSQSCKAVPVMCVRRVRSYKPTKQVTNKKLMKQWPRTSNSLFSCTNFSKSPKSSKSYCDRKLLKGAALCIASPRLSEHSDKARNQQTNKQAALTHFQFYVPLKQIEALLLDLQNNETWTTMVLLSKAFDHL